ncbi:hypothetical protein HanXRQr2_Chr12g0524351 [Helianthus annuus]|uniref:Uncharacterized protein n=1 Tax=Helianthus annuus TaxID=4232 RepID=A0A9K3EP42_HELAN|nr:hypothetical protein HanXRQr2_Chr12g0524351 [Helianthus annuus]
MVNTGQTNPARCSVQSSSQHPRPPESFFLSSSGSSHCLGISQFFTRALLQEFSYATNVSILEPILLLNTLGATCILY